ncbi:hypothetical protein RHA1_ro09149 (plasmid) [Rhodococcus jostii RHA1]|uniref:Uncharacterized protein n=1 Tax=Rhodococcus jostii (strain RHA1) TaxID=101510 RepID=Q0RWZ4_RHOJR|nr:hypothetical protein RHA1_ro09149 [Rhodococcus jostii RHA1]
MIAHHRCSRSAVPTPQPADSTVPSRPAVSSSPRRALEYPRASVPSPGRRGRHDADDRPLRVYKPDDTVARTLSDRRHWGAQSR